MTTCNMRAGQSVELGGDLVALVVEVIDEVHFKCQKFMTVEDIFMCGANGVPTMTALDRRERFLNIDVEKEKVERVSREVDVVYVEGGKEPPVGCNFFFRMTFSHRGNTFQDYKPGSCETKSSNLLAADLYCGCGGLSFACIEGMITPKVAVEKDKDACNSYQANHPEAEVHNMEVEEFNLVLKRLNRLEERSKHVIQGEGPSAITQVGVRGGRIKFCLGGVWLSEKKVGKEELGKFLRERESRGFPRPGTIGIVMGGTPCQGLSSANMRAPNKDIMSKKNNAEINNFLESIKLLDPDYVLLENVKDILTKDDGVYGKIAGLYLLTCGYQVRMGVMAAGNYGAPQERLRCFFWGAKTGKILPGFPKPLFAMPNSKWRCQPQNCHVRSGEDVTGARFPHVMLGDILSDLPPSSNFGSNGLYNYKSAPKTPEQVWLRRPTGKKLGNPEVMIPESRKRMIDEVNEEMENDGGADEGKRRRLTMKLGKAVMAEVRVNECRESRRGMEKILRARREALQYRIGAEVLKTNSQQLQKPKDQGEFLFDHLPHKMSSVDFERVLHIPKEDGAGIEKMPGVVKTNRGLCCGHSHDKDCPAHESEVRAGRGFLYSEGCSSKGHILSSKWYLVNKCYLNRKNSSFRRVDRWDTVGTLVGRCEPHMTCTKGMLHFEEHRCLTVAENKRIQGFPDKYILFGTPSSKMKQIGNAVSPHCAESLGYCLVHALEARVEQKFTVDIKSRSIMCRTIHEALERGIRFFHGKSEIKDLT